jgi:transketolase
LLSRQNLKYIQRTEEQVSNIRRGGYILIEGSQLPEAIIIATGSEVELAHGVCLHLNEQGHNIRLVSMPSTDAFDAQDREYRDMVLPPSCRKRIAVEAGIPDYWSKYVGLDGKVLGVNSFGESAPAADVYKHFGLTPEGLADMVKSVL